MRTLLRDEAIERARLLDVSSYDVDLDLTGDEDFRSTTVIRFTCSEPGASTFVELDAWPLEVLLNGRVLSLEREGNRIPLPDLQADNELRVVARCSYSRTGEGLHRFVDPADGEVYVWGQSFLDDAQRQFACFDQPDLKAVFRLQVTAPDDWTVIGNERGSRDGGRWTFAPTQRMSTYLFTVAAGPWHGERRVHDGIEMGVWCRQSLAPYLEAEELFEVTSQCFDSYHRTFGIRYPFGDTYDQLWVPEFNAGAMENVGAVTFAEDLLFRSRVTEGERRTRAMVIAHEMAHMWFGDLVTMRWWDDLWLNESFAELMGFWTVDVATRFDDGWTYFCTGRKAWGYAADQMPTTHPISGEVADNRSALLNFDGISYAKGASVLRQLMAWIGDETFFEGVRRYLREHEFGNTSLTDFLGALEQASGRDLDEWAQAWLRTPGVSTLRAAGDAVLQEPPADHPVLRDHRIRVGRYDRVDGELAAKPPIDLEVTGATTPVEGLLGHDLVLLNDGDLTFAKVRLDEQSLSTVVSRLRELADPLARALCWSAVYDTVRDAEVPARVLVDAVIGNVAAETDPHVVQTLLGQATRAALAWTADPSSRQALVAATSAGATAAEPASDLQLTWTRAWVDVATDVAALQHLLEAPPAGLAVDRELRWHVVRRLAQLGGVTAADIDAELAADTTAAGERHAAYAHAARPDPKAKREAWEAVMHDPSLANHRTGALAEGFWQIESPGLCRDYVEPYFAELPEMWQTRSPHTGRIIAARMYPSVLFEQDILDRTDTFLAQPTLHPGLRRVVLERQDDLRRAVTARGRHG
jgi:aminopeptidase N